MIHTVHAVNAALALIVVPGTVIWSYSVGALVAVIGLVVLFFSDEWQKARGLDKLVLFGPLFYAVPIAAFGTEHFTLTKIIASIVPRWIPWHEFWALLVGACFIAAALSLVTGIRIRLSASLLALTFFLFVVLMDIPGLVQNPSNRFVQILTLRELAFGAGPLALAASLMKNQRAGRILATVARYCIAISVLFYSFEQFLHADHVPGVPLEPLTPAYIPVRAFWCYFAAVAYAVGGVLLLIGKYTRAAATGVGLVVLIVVLAVYVPIAVVQFASLDNGLNYIFDTLMYCGTVLLLAGAMPRDIRTT